ncbi:MAG: hypothetical protein U0Y10_26150 [Spirosomataceae bacterium]
MGLLDNYKKAIADIDATTSLQKREAIRKTPDYSNVVAIYGFLKDETEGFIEVYLGGLHTTENAINNQIAPPGIKTDLGKYQTYLTQNSAFINISKSFQIGSDPDKKLIIAIEHIDQNPIGNTIAEKFVRDYFPHGGTIFYLNNTLSKKVTYTRADKTPLNGIDLDQVYVILRDDHPSGTPSGGTQVGRCN